MEGEEVVRLVTSRAASGSRVAACTRGVFVLLDQPLCGHPPCCFCSLSRSLLVPFLLLLLLASVTVGTVTAASVDSVTASFISPVTAASFVVTVASLGHRWYRHCCFCCLVHNRHGHCYLCSLFCCHCYSLPLVCVCVFRSAIVSTFTVVSITAAAVYSNIRLTAYPMGGLDEELGVLREKKNNCV